MIVSNCDLHIDTYKPADMPTAYGANNHGSMVQIGDDWYIFYHRHTNGTWYSRQGCAERLTFGEDGSIFQAEITSCGLNGGPLVGEGYYPAYLACNLFTNEPSIYVDERFPKIMQDGRDGYEDPAYLGAIVDGTTVGFKYFDMKNIHQISIDVRGYIKGSFEVKTAWDGKVLAQIPVEYTNVWKHYSTPVDMPDGVQALYFTFKGEGKGSLKGFYLEH